MCKREAAGFLQGLICFYSKPSSAEISTSLHQTCGRDLLLCLLVNIRASALLTAVLAVPAKQGGSAIILASVALCCIMGESPNFAQVIRPRFVASNLLCHRLVSEFAGLGEDALQESKNGTVNYRVFTSTWNVGGVAPPDDLDLEDWLDTRANSYDIYVLGFQEIVPLNARNVVGPKNSSATRKWNQLIGDALNKNKTARTRREEEAEAREQQQKQQSSFGFRRVASKQMVGIFVSVWARSGVRRHVRSPGVSCVGAGVLGRLGNKGAVSVRFLLHGTSFCFVCCHLASGSKCGAVLLRNADAADILSRTSFPTAAGLPEKILDHDRVVLLGDLNYRISMDDAEARLLVSASKWGMLLENDELLLELSEGRSFEGWSEGLVTFSPTYKYHRNSDKFYWCVDGGTAPGGRQKQQRAPAWCDRILWRGKGLKQIEYERCGGYKLSDHRPVRAAFDAVCEVAGGAVVVDSFLEGHCTLR